MVSTNATFEEVLAHYNKIQRLEQSVIAVAEQFPKILTIAKECNKIDLTTISPALVDFFMELNRRIPKQPIPNKPNIHTSTLSLVFYKVAKFSNENDYAIHVNVSSIHNSKDIEKRTIDMFDTYRFPEKMLENFSKASKQILRIIKLNDKIFKIKSYEQTEKYKETLTAKFHDTEKGAELFKKLVRSQTQVISTTNSLDHLKASLHGMTQLLENMIDDNGVPVTIQSIKDKTHNGDIAEIITRLLIQIQTAEINDIVANSVMIDAKNNYETELTNFRFEDAGIARRQEEVRKAEDNIINHVKWLSDYFVNFDVFDPEVYDAI